MRVLIIDDERLARNELRRLLAAFPDVELAGEARNAAEARVLIGELRPELIFLDIQMPDADGFELLEQLDDAAPAVIFTTAFDHYALRAFEVSALDYLVKPIAPDRLAAAVARAVARLDSVPSPLQSDRQVLGRGQRIFVRDGERCWFVPVETIVLVTSEGNYAQLQFAGECALVPRSLNALADRLDPDLFFRANRRQLINLDCIQSVVPWPNEGYRVTLAGGVEVDMSRRQARLFHARAKL